MNVSRHSRILSGHGARRGFSPLPLLMPILLAASGSCSSETAPRGDGGGVEASIHDGPPIGSKDVGPPPAELGPIVYQGHFPQASGDQWGTLTLGGVQRSVALYVPKTKASNPALLIVLHGTDGDGRDSIGGASAISLANEEGLIVAAPDARVMGDGDWDNHVGGQKYWESYPNTDPRTNPDLLLMRAIIAEAQKAYNADLRRVYVIGFSAGGFFSMLSAMSLPNQIAAFAEASSGMVRCPTTGDCTFVSSKTSCDSMARQEGYCRCAGPEKPGPVRDNGRKPPGYLTHGNGDGVVSVSFTCALALRMKELGYRISVQIRSTEVHTWPTNYAKTAWAFLSQHTLP